MSIIFEDGSVVANANSYQTLLDAQSLAVSMGLDLSAASEAQLIHAMSEINKYSQEFLSTRASADQAVLVDFPRVEFTDNNGFVVAANTIPAGVKHAQVQVCSDIVSGYSVYETVDGKNTSSEEVVGAVKVAYFNNGTDDNAQGGNKSLATINYLKLYIEPSSDLISTDNIAQMLINY